MSNLGDVVSNNYSHAISKGLEGVTHTMAYHMTMANINKEQKMIEQYGGKKGGAPSSQRTTHTTIERRRHITHYEEDDNDEDDDDDEDEPPQKTAPRQISLMVDLITLEKAQINTKETPHQFVIDLTNVSHTELVQREHVKQLITGIQKRTNQLHHELSEHEQKNSYFRDIMIVPKKSDGVDVSGRYKSHVLTLISDTDMYSNKWRYPYYVKEGHKDPDITSILSQSTPKVVTWQIGEVYKFD
jgi:hypothetical protein